MMRHIGYILLCLLLAACGKDADVRTPMLVAGCYLAENYPGEVEMAIDSVGGDSASSATPTAR